MYDSEQVGSVIFELIVSTFETYIIILLLLQQTTTYLVA